MMPDCVHCMVVSAIENSIYETGIYELCEICRTLLSFTVIQTGLVLLSSCMAIAHILKTYMHTYSRRIIHTQGNPVYTPAMHISCLEEYAWHIHRISSSAS